MKDTYLIRDPSKMVTKLSQYGLTQLQISHATGMDIKTLRRNFADEMKAVKDGVSLKDMTPGMRSSMVKDEMVTKMAADGAKLKDIAAFFQVDRSVITQSHQVAFDQGREQFKGLIRKSLVRLLKEDNPATAIHLSKTNLDNHEKKEVTKTIKHDFDELKITYQGSDTPQERLVNPTALIENDLDDD